MFKTQCKCQKFTESVVPDILQLMCFPTLPAYIVLTKVSLSLIPIISEMGDTSNLAANRGAKL